MTREFVLSPEVAVAALSSINHIPAQRFFEVTRDAELANVLQLWVSALDHVAGGNEDVPLAELTTLIGSYQAKRPLAGERPKGLSVRLDAFLKHLGPILLEIGGSDVEGTDDVLSFAYKRAAGDLSFKLEIFLAAMVAQTRREAVRVYYAYAAEDQKHADALSVHLDPLEVRGLIQVSAPDRTELGAMTRKDEEHGIDGAQVILLLISPNFLATCDWQLRRAMARAQSGQATVIPILVRPTAKWGAAYEALQPLPRDRRPLTTWKLQDCGWTAVMTELIRLFKKLHDGPRVIVT